MLYKSEIQEDFRTLFILLLLQPLGDISIVLLDHSAKFNTFSFEIPNVFHLLSRTVCVSIRYSFVGDDNTVCSTVEEKRISEESLLVSVFHSTFHIKTPPTDGHVFVLFQELVQC